MTDPGRPIMELDAITKSYGGHEIFGQLSLRVRNGSSTLIQGPSGCGKTTLLRCMALLERVDRGRIVLDGKIVVRRRQALRVRREDRIKVGIVFQDLHLWPHLSVFENVALPLYASGVCTRGEARTRAHKLLGEFGIADKAEDPPNTLSVGQRQRVAIARALVHSPKLLLLDEITSNLDSDTATRVYDAIEEIWKRGTAIVLVTHRSEVPADLRKQRVLFVDSRQGWQVQIEA